MSLKTIYKPLCDHFANAFIIFENSSIPDGILMNCPIQKPKFGILNLQMNKFEPIKKDNHIVFTIDCSGSMNDKCKDHRSKMDHIKHTLTNMVHYFIDNPEHNVIISVFTFDDKIYNIIEKEIINEKNVDKIIQLIQTIYPRDLTNIEIAIQNSCDFIDKCIVENSHHNITHIFMTDGDVTDGSSDITVLKSKVHKNVSNVFIGFGINHNAYMMNYLASDIQNSYFFIDVLEKSGLVYGEILHNIIYKILKNCEIYIRNGFIYDWKQNSWVNHLPIGEIVSEANKYFHLICEEPYTVECIFTNESFITSEICSLYIENRINIDNTFDFTKYKFRQQTLQILYDVNLYNFNKQQKDFRFQDTIELSSEIQKSSKITCKNILKERMTIFMKSMKDYMDSLPQDHTDLTFIKLLCDDIYICLMTLGTKNGDMFSCARQTSQGSQRIYSVKNIPTDSSFMIQHCISSFHDEHDTYKISDDADSPYLTLPAIKLMRSVTNGRQLELNETEFSLNNDKFISEPLFMPSPPPLKRNKTLRTQNSFYKINNLLRNKFEPSSPPTYTKQN